MAVGHLTFRLTTVKRHHMKLGTLELLENSFVKIWRLLLPNLSLGFIVLLSSRCKTHTSLMSELINTIFVLLLSSSLFFQSF